MVKHRKTIGFRLIYGTARACHKQDGIEDPKDLRAEIRKYLISTNERKKMSLLTIRKRIALVAVTALTAGVLTVATSPVANAKAVGVAGDIKIDIDQDDNTKGVGICAVQNSAGTYQTVDTTQRLYTSTLAAPLTVTMQVGGKLRFAPFSVTDPSLGAFFTYTANNTLTDDTDIAASEVLHSTYGVYAGTIIPNISDNRDTVTFSAVGVGTSTIRVYATAPFSAQNTPNSVFTTTGPSGSMTVVVVASCAATAGSTTYSAARADALPVAAANIADVTLTYGDSLTYGAGADAYITLVGKDAYNQVLPSTTTWIASATNDAKLTLTTSSATSASVVSGRGTLSVVSTTAAGTNVYVRVTPNSRSAGGSTVVTVTAGGVTLFSKTITFLPEPTKLVVVKNMSGTVGGQGAFSYQLQTAAGTAVPGSIEVRPLTLTTGVTAATEAKAASILPGASAGTTNTVNNTSFFSSTTSNGIMGYTCGVTASSTSNVTFRHTTAVSETVIDTVVPLTCGSSLATYTISLDKAAYAIGEIATITITAKDSFGSAVSDFTTIGGAGLTTISIGGGTITKAQVDGALGTGDLFTGGVRTYQAQMTTAGKFNTVVNLPGSTTKSATASYTVSGGDVTNATVLAQIVALIASINKQIAALQKLILKR